MLLANIRSTNAVAGSKCGGQMLRHKHRVVAKSFAQSLRLAKIRPCSFPAQIPRAVSVGREVDIEVEKPSGNVRVLKAGVDIKSPVEVVWSCLTDYDGLGDFVPSLAVNQCLERHPKGCKLLQVGEQDVAFGIRFSARCVMEITEFPSGLGPSCNRPQQRGCLGASFEGMAEPNSPYPEKPAKDITFVLLEGDFQKFTGVWRIQEGGAGPGSTRLSYAVTVSPMAWLPVGLIQNRIEREIGQNLRAVAEYAERKHRGEVPVFNNGAASNSGEDD